VDISASLGEVQTPTLVLHARSDEVVPIEEGRFVASGIRGAEFVELDSRNHVLLEHEPAWRRFQEAVLAFLKSEDAAPDSVFAALSARERQVLALIAEGLSNTDIAERRTSAKDRSQSRIESLRQARRVVPRASDRVRARPRLQ
jgi:DNA-binding NarL/FixJ family response regulator